MRVVPESGLEPPTRSACICIRKSIVPQALSSKYAKVGRESGAGEWTRTTDLSITNALLCQLSYSGPTKARSIYKEPQTVQRRIEPEAEDRMATLTREEKHGEPGEDA